MKLTVKTDGVLPLQQLADENRRIAGLLDEGFTSGVVVDEEGFQAGWWEVEEHG